MRLKDPQRNLIADKSLQRMRGSYGREYLDRQRRNAERSIGRARGLFENAFSNVPIGMALIDMDGRWMQVNSALCRITGYPERALKVKTLISLTHPDYIDLDVLFSQQLLDGKVLSYQVEKRCIHAWGHFVWVMMTVSLARDRKGRALYRIVQVQDISERKELAGRLEDLVDHDFLTGLFNRRHFEQELSQEIERASRYGSPGAVLLIDVDNFKTVNDTFGHTVGDDLLKGIAGSLKHRIRHTDTLARVGGDEFAVLLPQTNAEQAMTVAADFVKALDKETAVLTNQSFHITASLGVASFENLSSLEVLEHADVAMYGAKQAGRNRFLVYQPLLEERDRVGPRCSEADRMRLALEEDQFVLYCQPIMNLDISEVSQYELLLRLSDVEGCEPRMPNAFLYIAERFGLISAIDLWAVRKAIALIVAYKCAGQRLALNVNLSGKSIADPQLAGLIESALVEGGIDPACLVFEITETAAVANLQQARSFADRMHGCGCGLALDNFGAGLASFYFLKNFPFDYLKIDGEFIRSLSVNPVDRLVVQAIVCIAPEGKSILRASNDAPSNELTVQVSCENRFFRAALAKEITGGRNIKSCCVLLLPLGAETSPISTLPKKATMPRILPAVYRLMARERL
jgi:diguanylate cyclase (GGDEF)-like protein/PAS domain S-box-containing protein